MKRKYSSIPFIPLKIKDINNAVNNELILDTDNNKIFIQKENTKDLLESVEDRLIKDKEEKSMNYSFSIDMIEPDPFDAITYNEDAEGFIPLSINKENCNYGSWKNILETFFGIEPVLVNDGKVIAKLDPDNFNKILDEPFTKKAIYGFELNLNTNEISYTDDAITLPNIEFKEDGSINYNGWEKIILNLIGAKPVLYNSEKGEIADIDPYDYSKIVSQSHTTTDDVMIKFKHLYYYIDMNADIITFKIASYKVDESYKDDIFTNNGAFYVSAYNASEDINGNLVSRSGSAIKTDHEEYYYTTDILNKYLYMYLVGILIGNDPKLSVFGYGKSEDTVKVSGTMDTDGVFIVKDKSTKIFGAEDLLGNKVEFSNSVYADASSITYEATEEEEASEKIKIKKIIMIEANDLAYANASNMLYCTGANNILMYLKVPVRIFR